MKCCNTETKRVMHTTDPKLAARRTWYLIFTIQFLVPTKLYSHDGRDRGRISQVICDVIRIALQPAFTQEGRWPIPSYINQDRITTQKNI